MIEIITLGDFDIIIDGESIIEELSSQKKLIRLLKYFLVHNDLKLLPENIIEDLRGDNELKNPLNMLRTQISRLRTMIDYKNHAIKPFFDIKFINNYYVFQLEEGCKVDFIEFEDTFGKDIINLKKSIGENPEKIKETLLFYQGSLLREMEDENWIIPVRNRFSRLYVKGVSSYIEYFKEKDEYIEIVNICEKAVTINPYEEVIHMNFMEALAKLKQESYALIHYEFFTRKLYNDLGEKPSRDLVELYKKIKDKKNTDYRDVDLNTMGLKMVKEFDLDRAHLCELHYFKFLYSYKIANKPKNKDRNIGIGIITIENKNNRELTPKELGEGMKLLVYILFKYLFVGDVFSKWNKRQMLILLNNLKEENINFLISKIDKEFHEYKEVKDISLNIKIKIL